LPLGYPAGKKSIIERTHFVSTQCNSEFDVGRSVSDVGRSFGLCMTSRSAELFAKAQQRIPGGVNSPVRAFRSVGRDPFFVEWAEGAHICDVDGNKYIDYVGTWGPAILGHAPRIVTEAVRDAALR